MDTVHSVGSASAVNKEDLIAIRTTQLWEAIDPTRRYQDRDNYNGFAI